MGISFGAIGAVVLIAYGKDISFTRQRILGDLMILINAAYYGLYLVLVKQLMSKYHPITVVKWIFTFGGEMVFPFSYSQLHQVNWTSFGLEIWLAIAYVLIFTTFLAYLFNAYAIQQVSPSVVSIYMYLQPFLTTLIALAWGKDQLSIVRILAGLLIFSGVYLVSFGPVAVRKNT